MRTRRAALRGVTLIELMIAMTILLVAVSAASALIIAGMNMASVTERRGGAEDAVKVGLSAIVHAAQNAGLGAPQGVYVAAGGSKRLVSPIYGTNGGAADPDDLWLVVADNNSFRRCEDSLGGSTVVLSPGFGPLGVRCIASFNTGDTLLATNFQTGALLTSVNLTASPSPTINYAESGLAGFADSSLGFRTQDSVFRVRLLHFFIQVNPLTGRNALYMAQGQVATDFTNGPFADTGGQVVQDNIEDLQVAYGWSGNFQNTYAWSQVGQLSSLRLTLVATTPFPQRDSSGALRPYSPVPVEDHVPVGPNDGYERIMLTRRIDLANLLPSNL